MDDRTPDRRRLAVLAVLVVATVLFVVQAVAGDPTRSGGLGRYNPDAVAALGGAGSDGGTGLVAELEAQNICQQAAGYAAGSSPASTVLAAIDGSTTTAYATGRLRDQRVDIAELARRAKDEVSAAESSGSSASVQAFVDDACTGVDLGTPVLAGS